MIEIRSDGSSFTAEAFLALAQRVWPRAYDHGRAAAAVTRAANVGAWDGDRLVGAVRVLSDGYFFACVTEILVDPDYQRQGLGRRLMDAALAAAPRGKLFSVRSRRRSASSSGSATREVRWGSSPPAPRRQASPKPLPNESLNLTKPRSFPRRQHGSSPAAL